MPAEIDVVFPRTYTRRSHIRIFPQVPISIKSKSNLQQFSAFPNTSLQPSPKTWLLL
jgi:hypothetical protein